MRPSMRKAIGCGSKTMKIISINLGTFGSTGKIMYALTSLVEEDGGEGLMVYPSLPQNFIERDKDLKLTGTFNRKLNSLMEKLTGLQGCFSFRNTRRVVRYLKKHKPDIVHLHNIHGMKLHHGRLFKYLKKSGVRVIWTLHDCWSFTGQCPHFTIAKCDKWKAGCYRCPQYRQDNVAYIDRTKSMWKRKKKWFTGVPDMTLVTPSKWLEGLVRESFLREYPVQVIYNGIDLSVFTPTESDFRQKHGLENKKIVLGVSFGWDDRKGLDVFMELARRLGDGYKVVLVGTNEQTDSLLPKNILSVHRTQSQRELAEIYTAADVFVNPTREETFGLVNIEALACGTPVVTFRTGGSPEAVDERCGTVVPADDVEGTLAEIVRICEQKPYKKEDCVARASQFSAAERFEEYLELYKA